MLMAVGISESTARRSRRTKAEMLRLRVAARTLDLEGKTRKHIALTLGVTLSQITAILGPSRDLPGRPKVPRGA